MDPNVLVGLATSDDAAVYRLDADKALVATVDLFTPVVDDPVDFGRIAAANSLSDIYAMGAQPLFALAMIGFPSRTLPLAMMADILRGGVEKAAEAGIAVVGGHSIDDPEPKYGLSVLGLVHPDRVIKNSTAQPGDVVVLTKPIGTGVVSHAIKQGAAALEEMTAAVATMARLNQAAALAMTEVGVSAATDVTGFGLIGHLHEVVHSSGLSAHVRACAVPLLPGAERLAAAGIVPGGSIRNAAHFDRFVRWDDDVDPTIRALLCDAQTSGGLLICVPGAKAGELTTALARRSVLQTTIGEIESGPPGLIRVSR